MLWLQSNELGETLTTPHIPFLASSMYMALFATDQYLVRGHQVLGPCTPRELLCALHKPMVSYVLSCSLLPWT